MALKFDIRESDGWFTNTDYTIKLRVWAADGVTPLNVAGYAMSWMLKKRLTDADVNAVITKTTLTGITVTGVFNADPLVNTQLVIVPILDDDTDGTFKAGVYAHELKRTDPGFETVLCHGSAVIRASAHRS